MAENTKSRYFFTLIIHLWINFWAMVWFLKKKGFEWTFTTSFEEKKEPLKVMFLYWNINLQKYRIKIDI